MDEPTLLGLAAIEELCVALSASGTSPDTARRVARSIAAAESDGLRSHARVDPRAPGNSLWRSIRALRRTMLAYAARSCSIGKHRDQHTFPTSNI